MATNSALFGDINWKNSPVCPFGNVDSGVFPSTTTKRDGGALRTDWWNDYNEYHVPEYNPVITSFRRPSTRVVVATRPFACFPAGTLVSTETGKQPIEKLRVGDRVLSKNPFTGELRYQPILQTTVRDSDAILELFMDVERLYVTRGHPMWVNGRQWQMAKQLRRGDRLHGAKGPATVEALRQVRGTLSWMKITLISLAMLEFSFTITRSIHHPAIGRFQVQRRVNCRQPMVIMFR